MQRPALTKMPGETSRATVLHYALLAGVILIGLALRTVNIGRDPLWTDEALTLVLAQWPVWDMITKPTDPTPFFYYALHKWFVPEGAGVVGVRSISLVAGVLAMPVMYAIGRMIFSREGALLATALLAVSAPLIDYSQEARAYSVLVLLVLLSAAGLIWWFREKGGRRAFALLLLVATSSLGLYTHFIAIFWVGPAVLILLLLGRRISTRHEREALWGSVVIVLLAVPEAVRIVQASVIGGGFDWLQQASPAVFFTTLRSAFLPPGGPIVATAFVIGLAWLVLGMRQGLRDWVVQRPPAAAVIIALALLPLPIWLFGFVERPIFLPRTVLIAIPGFVLAVTLLVALDPWAARRQLISVLIVSLYLGALVWGGTARPKEPWGEARRALADRRPGDIVVVCPFWKYPALRHAMGEGFAPAVSAPHGETMLQVQRGNSQLPWQRAYFATVSRPLFQLVTTGSLSPTLGRHIVVEKTPARAWSVASECEAHHMQAIRHWLGQGSWSLATVIPADQPYYPAIELLRFEADRPRTRTVVGLR
jgi:mannosyltransferase